MNKIMKMTDFRYIRGEYSYYFPLLGRAYWYLDKFALVIFRFFLGIILIGHGVRVIFGILGTVGEMTNAASLSAVETTALGSPVVIVCCLTSIAGFLIAFGFLTRPSALIAAIFIVWAIALPETKLNPWAIDSIEHLVFIGLSALLFVVKGGGFYSIDTMIGREL